MSPCNSTWNNELINACLNTLDPLEELAIDIWQNLQKEDTKPGFRKLVEFPGTNREEKCLVYETPARRDRFIALGVD
jgi:hypothetical protein